MELDIQKFAVDLWAKWLDHPSNVDFKNLYNDKRVGEEGEWRKKGEELAMM